MKKRFARMVVLVFAALFVGGMFTQQVKAEDDDLHVYITDSNGIQYEPEGNPIAEHPETSGTGWSYSKSANTLTLENYNGGRIYVDSSFGGSNQEFTLVLKGDNCITADTDETGNSLLNVGRHLYPLEFTIKGEGMLTVNQTGANQNALSADDLYIEDTVTVICTAKGDIALGATCVHLAKGATIRLKAAKFAFWGAGTDDLFGKNEIYGTIFAETTGDYNNRQPFYYTSYTTILGSDRVIYCGKNEKDAELVIPIKEYGAEYMPSGYLGSGIIYDYVAVISKDAAPAATDTPSDEMTVKKVTLSSVKSSKAGYAKLKWKKVSGANGYEIYYSAEKNGTYKKLKTITKAKTNTYTKKKLASGKTYYFKLRAYKTVDGKKVYGKYSVVKSVKVK